MDNRNMHITLLTIAAGFVLHAVPHFPIQNARESPMLAGVVPPVEMAPAPRQVAFSPPDGGVVIEVTKTSITLQGISATFEGEGVESIQRDERNASIVRGNPLIIRVNDRTIRGITAVSTRETLTITSASGSVTTIRRIDQPLWRFEASEELVAREIPADVADLMIPPPEAYRLGDVRVGDMVAIESRREGGVNICEIIRIVRRPGGRIPPAPGEPANQKIKYHERMQAYQDLEEKGTPIPDRLLPSWELARRAKIAPMPREVVPRIPTKMP